MAEIGSKIKHLRELKKLTVKDMAQKLNMSEPGYNKIERGDTDIPFSRLNQIADALGERVEDLISFDPKYYFNHINMNTINGHIYSNLADNERKLYEENIALLKEKIKSLEGGSRQ